MTVRDDDDNVVPERFLSWKQRHGLDEPQWTLWYVCLLLGMASLLPAVGTLVTARTTIERVGGAVWVLADLALFALARWAWVRRTARDTERYEQYQQWLRDQREDESEPT
ncbi:hypothetical protein ACPFP2_00195 [Micromonospora citrea]|uniref:hypothetical protein n=1 Tax=Micromonospora citrea TaxID=47855 RepID=UPI003C375A08